MGTDEVNGRFDGCADFDESSVLCTFEMDSLERYFSHSFPTHSSPLHQPGFYISSHL